MSAAVDSKLPPEFRARLLAEIRTYLPAFLHGGASERRDPVGDVSELLNLQAGQLRKVVAVHSCLDERVLALGEALAAGMREPVTSSERPPESSQCVRGSVDWGATVAQRSREGGDASRFVIRSAQRVFDTPANRALAWVLQCLHESARTGLGEAVGAAAAMPADEEISKWPLRIKRLAVAVERARGTSWLRDVRPEMPDVGTIQRLRAAGNRFYSVVVADAARVLLELADPSEQVLVEMLCRRYFEPAQTSLLYEVWVALRLARAFEAASGRPRKARLLVRAGECGPYARFDFDDGSEVSLTYQGWPAGLEESRLERAAARHGFSVGLQPDIFIVRSGPEPDIAVLELKASVESSTLAKGLKQLYAYLGDRPLAWKRRPAGWLVAPASSLFSDRAAGDEDDLWMLSAEQVVEAAVGRFAPAATASA